MSYKNNYNKLISQNLIFIKTKLNNNKKFNRNQNKNNKN